MNNLVKINNHELQIKEFENQRVITFKDIDTVHERPAGTARKRFNDNKKRFIKNVDYFIVKPADIQLSEKRTIGINGVSNRGTILITESGYLMLVKSLTDDLAWEVQRSMVNNYFKGKQLVNSLNKLSPQLQLLINLELKQKQIESEVNEAKQQIASVKENIIVDVKDWRKWANSRIRAIGASLGDYSTPYAESYEELERRARCNLDRRLQIKRENMLKAGAGKKKIDTANYLDIIEEDTRLKEIYTSIVKEMCVKYL